MQRALRRPPLARRGHAVEAARRLAPQQRTPVPLRPRVPRPQQRQPLRQRRQRARLRNGNHLGRFEERLRVGVLARRGEDGRLDVAAAEAGRRAAADAAQLPAQRRLGLVHAKGDARNHVERGEVEVAARGKGPPARPGPLHAPELHEQHRAGVDARRGHLHAAAAAATSATGPRATGPLGAPGGRGTHLAEKGGRHER